PMPVEVNTLTFIRGCITTEPRSHKYGVEIPALRPDMSPVPAETRTRNFEIANSEIVPAKSLPGDITCCAGITEKQTEAVKMSAIRLATQNILSRLNTKELSVETRCNRSPPFHINILPEDPAPTRRQISGSFQQILFAATFM